MLRTYVLTLCLALPGAQLLADCQRIAPVNVVDTANGATQGDSAVTVSDGRIIAVGPSDSPGDGCTLIDGQNGYLLPGLAEMHAHVPGQAQGDAATQKVLDLFLANGVTTIRGMLGEPWHLELRHQLASGERRGPRLVTSGPSFNGSTVSDPEQAILRVREQAAAGYDFLKIHPGLSRDEFVAVAGTARAAGIPIAGHVSYQTGLETALAERQDCIDHLDAYAEALVPPGTALSGVAPDWFGLNLASEFDTARIARLARATADAGTWNAPTQSLFETTVGDMPIEQLMARPGMDVLSDALARTWVERLQGVRELVPAEQRARFLEARRALIKALQDAGAGLLLGSDAPQIMNVPGYSAHQELAWLVEAGLTPLQALQTGTVNVARYFDEADRGQVAPGFVADLVLLAGNPLQDITATTGILGVMRNGHWSDRAELDRLLAEVRRQRL